MSAPAVIRLLALAEPHLLRERERVLDLERRRRLDLAVLHLVVASRARNDAPDRHAPAPRLRHRHLRVSLSRRTLQQAEPALTEVQGVHLMSDG
jgi:hypothetical protein